MRQGWLVQGWMALLLAASLGITAGRDTAVAGDVAQAAAGSYLLVQQAAWGSLEPLAGRPGQYRLTLAEVPPSIVYFADRPTREVGQLAPQTLVEHWAAGADSLAADPPNAALDFLDGPIGQMVVVMGLAEPAYDAAARTMSYRATLLPWSDRPGLAALIGRGVAPEIAIPREFGAAVLFVDDVCLSCW